MDLEEDSLHLHVISRHSGKTAIANTATGLLRQFLADPDSTVPKISVKEKDLNAILEGMDNGRRRRQDVHVFLPGKYGFTGPDLMIIHNIIPQKRSKDVLELYGFPPWQIRLTEF